jgi:hypothetical protein
MCLAPQRLASNVTDVPRKNEEILKDETGRHAILNGCRTAVTCADGRALNIEWSWGCSPDDLHVKDWTFLHRVGLQNAWDTADITAHGLQCVQFVNEFLCGR